MARKKKASSGIYRCNVCGAEFGTVSGVQGHIGMKKDEAHQNSTRNNYTVIEGTTTPAQPAPPAQLPPTDQPVRQPMMYAAQQPDPRLDKICTTVECLQGQMNQLMTKFSQPPPAEPTPPPADPEPPADHGHGHGEYQPATVKDVIKHAIECKDGKCRVVARKAILTNWSKLFPKLSVLDQAQRAELDEYLEKKNAEEEGTPPTAPPADQPAAPTPTATPPAEPPRVPAETTPPPATPPATPPAEPPPPAPPPTEPIELSEELKEAIRLDEMTEEQAKAAAAKAVADAKQKAEGGGDAEDEYSWFDL